MPETATWAFGLFHQRLANSLKGLRWQKHVSVCNEDNLLGQPRQRGSDLATSPPHSDRHDFRPCPTCLDHRGIR